MYAAYPLGYFMYMFVRGTFNRHMYSHSPGNVPSNLYVQVTSLPHFLHDCCSLPHHEHPRKKRIAQSELCVHYGIFEFSAYLPDVDKLRWVGNGYYSLLHALDLQIIIASLLLQGRRSEGRSTQQGRDSKTSGEDAHPNGSSQLRPLLRRLYLRTLLRVLRLHQLHRRERRICQYPPSLQSQHH